MNNDGIWLWLVDSNHFLLDLIYFGNEGRNIHLLCHIKCVSFIEHQYCISNCLCFIHQYHAISNNYWIWNIFNIDPQLELNKEFNIGFSSYLFLSQCIADKRLYYYIIRYGLHEFKRSTYIIKFNSRGIWSWRWIFTNDIPKVFSLKNTLQCKALSRERELALRKHWAFDWY